MSPDDVDAAANKIMEKALAELAALFAQEAGQSAAVVENCRWWDDRWPVWYRNTLLDHARGEWPDAHSGPAS